MDENMRRLLAECEAELASDSLREPRPDDRRSGNQQLSPEVQEQLRGLLGGSS